MVGRLTLSNGCVSGLKEVRARTVGFGSIDVRCDVRYSMFDAMFDAMFNRPSVWYLKKLETLAKVEEVVTS